MYSFFFFFNDTATTEIYTLSLHDALPIYPGLRLELELARDAAVTREDRRPVPVRILVHEAYCVVVSRHARDRKSTRLNSSHSQISYAVFCLKKKKLRLRHVYIRVFLTWSD